MVWSPNFRERERPFIEVELRVLEYGMSSLEELFPRKVSSLKESVLLILYFSNVAIFYAYDELEREVELWMK